MKVRALQAVGVNKVELTEFPKPVVKEDAVLIRICYCGICGTDIHGIQGKRDIRFPIIPGHELVGTVEEIGSRALETTKVYGGKLKVGDMVTINPRIVCGQCYYCRNLPGHPEMCTGARTYNSSIRSDSPPYLFGGWAQYIYILPRSEIVRLPEGIDPEIAALTEPFACAVGLVDRYRQQPDHIAGAGSTADETIVVFGAGAIGLFATVAFHLAGARQIVVVDVIDERLSLAKEFGAIEVINAGQTSPEERTKRVKDLSDGLGAGVVIEACGVPETIGEGVKMLRRGGKLFEMGHLFKTGPARIDPLTVCRNEIEILGHYAYPSSQCLVDAAGLLAEGKLPYERLIKSFPLEEYQEVLFGKRKNAIVKTVFRMGKVPI